MRLNGLRAGRDCVPGPRRGVPGRSRRVDGASKKYSVVDTHGVPGPGHRVSVCDADWTEHSQRARPGSEVANDVDLGWEKSLVRDLDRVLLSTLGLVYSSALG